MTTAQGTCAAALGASLLFLSGCGGNGGETEAALEGVDIPTQEEADASADASITEQNADEVLDQLSREVDAESNEGG